MGFELVTKFIAHFFACDYTLQIIIKHRLVFSVTLLGNSFNGGCCSAFGLTSLLASTFQLQDSARTTWKTRLLTVNPLLHDVTIVRTEYKTPLSTVTLLLYSYVS
jgi:hypothetical protein